jgi:hypothetical protein
MGGLVCGFTSRRALVLATLILVALPLPARAGAWTQPQGSFYVKLSYALAWADEQIKCCVDEPQPLLDFRDRGDVTEGALSLYGEYGLPVPVPGGLTVLAAVTMKFLEIDTERALRTTAGFADLSLGVRWGLPLAMLAPVVLAVQIEGKIPTGYTANLPGGEQIPYLGNGVFELTSSLLAGVSFWPPPVYVTGGLGFRWRGEDENAQGRIDYANELPWSLEAGVTLAERVLVQATLDGIVALGDVEELDVAALTPPASRSVRAGAGLIVLPWRGLQVGVSYQRVLGGVNVILSDQVTLGVAWAQ